MNKLLTRDCSLELECSDKRNTRQGVASMIITSFNHTLYLFLLTSEQYVNFYSTMIFFIFIIFFRAMLNSFPALGCKKIEYCGNI